MAESSDPRTRRGFIGKWVARAMTMIVWLLLALFMSIITEWVGMNTKWKDEGSDHSRSMVQAELAYLNKDFRQSLIVQKPVAFAEGIATKMHTYMYEKTGVMSYLRSSLGDTKAGDTTKLISDHALAAVYITQVFSIRLAVLILATPAFFIFAFVAAVEGLVQRDIRKWSVGREHAGLYHHSKRWIPVCFIAPWVIYLAFPVTIHPNAVILPFAALFGFGIYMVTYLFKKHL